MPKTDAPAEAPAEEVKAPEVEAALEAPAAESAAEPAAEAPAPEAKEEPAAEAEKATAETEAPPAQEIHESPAAEQVHEGEAEAEHEPEEPMAPPIGRQGPNGNTRTYLTAFATDELGPAGHFLDLTDEEFDLGEQLHPGVLLNPTSDQLARRVR